MLLTKLKTTLAIIAAVGVLALSIGSFGIIQGRAAPQPSAQSNIAAQLQPPDEDDQPKPDKKARKDQDKQDKKAKRFPVQDGRASVEEIVTRSFKTKASPRIVVGTFNGAIEVKTGAEGAVKAKVVKSVRASTEEAAQEDLKNIDVQMTQEADVVRIIAKTEIRHWFWLTNRRAAVELQVPPGAALELGSSNGKITVAGPIADVSAKSSNGGIEVQGSKGKVHLKTSNGRISAESTSGPLDLHTSNGAIAIKGAKATVVATTSNGAIHFSGSLADGEHSFHTSNGSITLTLPADARFRVDAQTSNGQAVSQFTVRGPDSKKKNRLQGTVGDNPSTSIKLRTFNSRIEIRKEK